MEVKSFSSDVLALERKMASSLAEFVVFETLLAAQRSLVCLVLVTGLVLKGVEMLPILAGNDQSFPFAELHKKGKTEPENVDGSDTEEDEDDDNAEEPDDDEGDEDFSGEEGGDDDDDQGDPDEDPQANGNEGSDDDDDEEDNDDDDDEEEEEEEDEEDEEEKQQPPAKKRK